jgi:hypothetical protein
VAQPGHQRMCKLPVRLPVRLPGPFAGAALAFTRRENTMRKMRRLYRIGALAGAIFLPIGAVLATGTPEASATSGSEYCFFAPTGPPACLNAWGGGPYVKVEENANPVIQNNYFKILYEPDGNVELEFVGGGAWSGECIGDAKNLPGNADTSLDPCGTNGANAGWGTQFSLWTMGGGPSQGDGFYNLHWKGFLGPPSKFVDGSAFYLNKNPDTPIYFQPS